MSAFEGVFLEYERKLRGKKALKRPVFGIRMPWEPAWMQGSGNGLSRRGSRVQVPSTPPVIKQIRPFWGVFHFYPPIYPPSNLY